MKNSVWFVSDSYWPVENATGHIVTRIVDKLSEEQKIKVISSGDKVESRNPNIEVTRVNLGSNLNKNNLFQRIIKHMLLSVGYFAKLFSVKKNDTVIAVTNPAPLLVFIALLKPIIGYKFVIVVHDVFPENLVVAGMTKENSMLYRVVKRLFDFAYRRGDVLITCGRDIQALIKSKVRNKKSVISIPNFCDIINIRPCEKQDNVILKEHGLENKFVVLFTGNMGRVQGIDNIMDAAKILSREQEDDIHFLFIGDGACKSRITEAIDKNNLRNITYLPPMDRTRANDFLNAGDVGLVTLIPNMRGTGVPSKSYTYLAAGKPLVAVVDEDSEIALTINEHGVGWRVNPDDSVALAELVKRLKSSPQEIRDKVSVCRNAAEKYFSTDFITGLYREEINKVINCNE